MSSNGSDAVPDAGIRPQKPRPARRWSPALNALFIACVSVSGIFALASVLAQFVAPEQDSSSFLFFCFAVFLVGAGNVVVWRFVLSRRSPDPAPGQYTGQTVGVVLALVLASIVIVAGMQFVGVVVFVFATGLIQW